MHPRAPAGSGVTVSKLCIHIMMVLLFGKKTKKHPEVEFNDLKLSPLTSSAEINFREGSTCAISQLRKFCRFFPIVFILTS